MPLRQNELETLALWPELDRLSSALDNWASNLDMADRDILDGLRSVAATARELRAAPSWRFPGRYDSPDMILNVLGQRVAGAAHELEVALLLDPPTPLAELPDLWAAYDAVVTTLDDAVGKIQSVASWPSPDAAILDGFRRDSAAAFSSLQSRIAERLEEIEAVKVAIDESHTKLAGEVTALEATIATSTANVAGQVTRLDSAIASQQETFTSRLGKWETDLASTMEIAEEEARVHVASIDDLETQARGLVEATATWTIGAGYAGYASKQESRASLWGLGAVVVAILGIGYLIWTLKDIAGVDTGEAIFKSTAGISIVLAAGYMASVSRGHFAQARDARRVQLDLDALEPFMSRFDNETRESLRTLIALRIFGRVAADSRHGESNPFGHVLDGASQTVLSALKLKDRPSTSPD